MSIEKIHLRKLLQLFYLPANQRTSLLRSDIRQEQIKALGAADGGGDFHGAFWADAKAHVTGDDDLRTAVLDRINRNQTRKRLYPLLEKGFLGWWRKSADGEMSRLKFCLRKSKLSFQFSS